MKKDQFNEMLNKGLNMMGLQTREDLTDNLYKYMNYLLQENMKYNLTAIDDPGEVINKHFFDSLIFFTKCNPEKGTKVIDIGTGAGFPGLVLKLYRPDLDIILVDSLKKRVNFLNDLINDLNLAGIEALHARAEELGNNEFYREQFKLSVSRAVASINILSEYTIPFLHKGGSSIYFKGPDYLEESNEGLEALEILGGKLKEVYKVNVPGVEGERYLVEVTKVEITPAKYPRRPGMPKKRPL